MSRKLYAMHRWISALALAQLAAWTVSGFFFVVVPMTRVHGEHNPDAHEVPIGQGPAALSPSVVLACLAMAGLPDATRVELRATHAGLFYVGRAHDRAVRLDARSCAAAPVGQAEAEGMARRDQPGQPPVRSAEVITEADVEYRGKPVPAWRVVLGDGEDTTVYVDARTGEVTARRNRTWRAYDFLWSLHIMSYTTRDGFNHPLIIGAAALALLTVMSGVALWALRLARRLAGVRRRMDCRADPGRNSARGRG